MTALYRKLPIPVEARQVGPSSDGHAGLELAAWCGGSVSGTYDEPLILVPTLEGDLKARVGDWIVKGPRGEFWPVKGDIFAEDYTPCDEPESGSFHQQIVHQLQCQGAMSEHGAVELADAVRREGLLKAIGRLRAIPVTCTALTGPVWYGTGWKECITALEDIADYQRPDDEAYPGELQRLRALYLQLRVAALRKEDLAEAQRLLLVQAEHEAEEREKSAASSGDATPDFFQEGHTYRKARWQAEGEFWTFHVASVAPSPDGLLMALGFVRGYGGWVSNGEVDFDGWVELAEAVTE